MKNTSLFFALLIHTAFTGWQPTFEKAKQLAQQEHKAILLNFSGSDWCGPCIRLRKEIFDNPAFSGMADSLLVMYDADFPRNKKNQLAKAAQLANDALADKYNTEGKFPLTLLLDENGKILKSWDGLPKETAAQFAADIRGIVHASK